MRIAYVASPRPGSRDAAESGSVAQYDVFTPSLKWQDGHCAGGGCCANPRSYTRHGFEQHIGVNHFGYAALVDALLPKLRAQVSVVDSSRVPH